jgi:hypothetical protein
VLKNSGLGRAGELHPLVGGAGRVRVVASTLRTEKVEGSAVFLSGPPHACDGRESLREFLEKIGICTPVRWGNSVWGKGEPRHRAQLASLRAAIAAEAGDRWISTLALLIQARVPVATICRALVHFKAEKFVVLGGRLDQRSGGKRVVQYSC